jgi:predicted TIM-barrel fold metal-dependent hydrolase
VSRDCLGPGALSRPRIKIPPGAWDTHFHVLGPQARFPYSPKRKYTPPDAPLDRALALHDALGIARGVVVHANTHGFDNAVDLDAVARSNGRYLAVVRLDASATPSRCEVLHAKARAACASLSTPSTAASSTAKSSITSSTASAAWAGS